MPPAAPVEAGSPPSAGRFGEELLHTGLALEAHVGRVLRMRTDLSLQQLRVLAALGTNAEPREPRQLARALGLHPASLHHNLSQLEHLGLIAQQEHPTDRRRRLLTLTEVGETRYREAASELDEELTALVEHIPSHFRLALAEQLHSIRKRLARRGVGRPGP